MKKLKLIDLYAGNKRPYSQWRSNNSFWDQLVTDVYP